MKGRPLSPFLWVYRLPATAWLSIAHRATGMFVFMGLSLFSWMLVALYFAPGLVRGVFEFFPVHILVRVVLLVWSSALSYHYCNGIRHLFWDCGMGFSKSAATVSGYVTLGIALFVAFLLAVYVI